MENRTYFIEFDLFEHVGLLDGIEVGLKGLVTNRPFLFFAEESDVGECLSSLFCAQIELNLCEQTADPGSLHFLRESGIRVGNLVDLQNLPDGIVPAMSPNHSWFTTLKTFGESSRQDDVSNAVLVAYTGYKALNDSLCLVDGDLSTGTGFELDTCEKIVGHEAPPSLMINDRRRLACK